jgi:tetratricopeptide (TPR) repeat protein
VEIERRTLGEEHPYTLTGMNNLAIMYRDEGKLKQAEALLGRVLEVYKRTLGERHPYTLFAMHNLGDVYRSEGKYDQGAILIRKVLDEKRRTLGNEHSDTLYTMHSLARLYVEQGKDDQAEALLTAFLEIRRHDPSSLQRGTTSLTSLSDTAGVLALLGRLRLRQHRYSEAEAALREGLEGGGKNAPVPWQRYEMQSMLGASLVAQARFEEAEPLLLSAYQALTLHQHEIPWASRSTAEQTNHRIIKLYQSWGKPDKAEAWRREHP